VGAPATPLLATDLHSHTRANMYARTYVCACAMRACSQRLTPSLVETAHTCSSTAAHATNLSILFTLLHSEAFTAAAELRVSGPFLSSLLLTVAASEGGIMNQYRHKRAQQSKKSGRRAVSCSASVLYATPSPLTLIHASKLTAARLSTYWLISRCGAICLHRICSPRRRGVDLLMWHRRAH
jgi:hypothetical protein